MQTETNIVADIVFGFVFSALGSNLIFRRRRVIDALIASSNVFWGKVGISSDEKKSTVVTKVMIPIMGITFMAAGVVMIYKAVVNCTE